MEEEEEEEEEEDIPVQWTARLVTIRELNKIVSPYEP